MAVLAAKRVDLKLQIQAARADEAISTSRVIYSYTASEAWVSDRSSYIIHSFDIQVLMVQSKSKGRCKDKLAIRLMLAPLPITTPCLTCACSGMYICRGGKIIARGCCQAKQKKEKAEIQVKSWVRSLTSLMIMIPPLKTRLLHATRAKGRSIA